MGKEEAGRKESFTVNVTVSHANVMDAENYVRVHVKECSRK